MKKIFAMVAFVLICSTAMATEKESTTVSEGEQTTTYVGIKKINVSFVGSTTQIQVETTHTLETSVSYTFTFPMGTTSVTVPRGSSISNWGSTSQLGGRGRITSVSPLSYGTQNYSSAIGEEVEF